MSQRRRDPLQAQPKRDIQPQRDILIDPPLIVAPLYGSRSRTMIFRNASFFLGARFVAVAFRLCRIRCHGRDALAISCSLRSSVARDTPSSRAARRLLPPTSSSTLAT